MPCCVALHLLCVIMPRLLLFPQWHMSPPYFIGSTHPWLSPVPRAVPPSPLVQAAWCWDGQELCQLLLPACLLQCQFINIEELIRILQPFPSEAGGYLSAGFRCSPALKALSPGLSQLGGLCPPLCSWLIPTAKAPQSLASGKLYLPIIPPLPQAGFSYYGLLKNPNPGSSNCCLGRAQAQIVPGQTPPSRRTTGTARQGTAGSPGASLGRAQPS